MKENSNKSNMQVGKGGMWDGLHFTRERFKIVRKIVAYATSDSWDKVPHVSFNYEPDVTEFFKQYQLLKQKHSPDHNITLNSVLIKVIVEALKAAPHLNAYVEYNKTNSRGTLDVIEEINISMPSKVDEDTTVTVNMPNVNNKSIVEINNASLDIRRRAQKTNFEELYYRMAFQQSMDELKKLRIVMVLRRLFAGNIGKDKVFHLKGKEKKDYYSIPETERLTLEDVRRGTLVVTNIGSVLRDAPVSVNLLEIIPPQVMAIALAAISEKPIVVKNGGDSTVEVRKVLSMCIAFDHRAYDFDAMAPFVNKLEEIFANPEIIHSW